MNAVNYQKELDKILSEIEGSDKLPKLLVHSCCAPCSSYVLEYLNPYFKITVLYYNPNISPVEEYEKRKAEQIRLINEGDWKNPIEIMDCDYEGDKYTAAVKGLENEPEGGARCRVCFGLRLDEAARLARANDFDYFVTTLSISPLKNARLLNEIGNKLGEKYGIKYLPSDFKKREGYKRSIELSRRYNLYRQNFCGCKYSKSK
ncbi:MAG: hypothetical protein EGR16_03150 [Clostridiales bacterium]|nr:hypothetical protein [Clostridiales bacterium]